MGYRVEVSEMDGGMYSKDNWSVCVLNYCDEIVHGSGYPTEVIAQKVAKLFEANLAEFGEEDDDGYDD